MDEMPQHRVRLSAYYAGRFPVTQAQYALFVRATRHPLPGPATGPGRDYAWDRVRRKPPTDREDHPVVLVSWEDAAAFCAWAGLRLPTEAEWEKAARGTDGRIYPWGDRWDAACCNSSERGPGGTTPAGAYSPQGDSPCGCADMAGNVWEWCADWYGSHYYRHAPAVDPQGPEEGSQRVLRGGGWDYNFYRLRAAYRNYLDPAYRYSSIGFRCAVSAAG